MLTQKTVLAMSVSMLLVACGGGGGAPSIAGKIEVAPPPATQPTSPTTSTEKPTTPSDSKPSVTETVNSGFLAALDQPIPYNSGFTIEGPAGQGSPVTSGKLDPKTTTVDALYNDVILAKVEGTEGHYTQYMVYGNKAPQVPSVKVEYDGKGYINTDTEQIPMLFVATYDPQTNNISGGLVKQIIPTQPSAGQPEDDNNILITFSSSVDKQHGTFAGNDATIEQYGGQPKWKDQRLHVQGSFFGTNGVGGVISSPYNPSGVQIEGKISGVFVGEAQAPSSTENTGSASH